MDRHRGSSSEERDRGWRRSARPCRSRRPASEPRAGSPADRRSAGRPFDSSVRCTPHRRRRRSSARAAPSCGSLPVAVRAVGAPDLAGEVADGDELLGPGRQVAQADLAVGQLVADDHREVGVLARGGLELLAELAAAELGPGRDPRRSQIRGDRSRPTVSAGSAPTTTATGPAPRPRSAPRSRSGRGSADRGRSRTRCPASAGRRAARPGRRSALRHRWPAAGPRDR